MRVILSDVDIDDHLLVGRAVMSAVAWSRLGQEVGALGGGEFFKMPEDDLLGGYHVRQNKSSITIWMSQGDEP